MKSFAIGVGAVVVMLAAAQVAHADPPSVTNGSGATPGRGVATLNGNLLSTGGESTTVYTYWGESDGGTNKLAWGRVITNGVRAVGPFSADTPPTLLYGQEYHYRTYATNDSGEVWAAATTNFVTLSPGIEAPYVNYDCGGTKPTGPGVVGEPGDLWNQSTGGSGWKDVSSWNLASLVDPAGTIIPGAALTITQPANYLGFNGTQVPGVGNGNGPTLRTAPFDLSLGDGGGSRILWTVRGLSEASSYDVYVFWGYGAHAGKTVTVNGSAPQTFTYAVKTALPVDGRDYRLFSKVVAAGGKVDVLLECPDTNAGISGFQIVRVIPPPSIENTFASAYTSTSAVLHATLECDQSVYDVYAYWNTVNGGTNASLWTNSAYVGSWTNVAATNISHLVTGLVSNGPYYFTFRALNAAEDLWANNVLTFPHSEKDLLTFGLPGLPAVIAGTNITWTIPYGADASSLAPEYTVSDLAVGDPASGSTNDFTSPLTYTVTAQDFSARDYRVTITHAARPSDFYWVKAHPRDGAWSGLYNWTNETGLAGAPLAGGGTDYHLHFSFDVESYVVTHDLGDGFLLNQLSIATGSIWRRTVNISGNSLVFTNYQGQLPRINVNKDEDFVISSPLVLADDLYIGGNQNANITIPGPISGDGGIIRTRGGGWGSLLLSGPKTFAGGVTLGEPGWPYECTVRIDNVASLGTGALRSEVLNAQLILAADLSAGAGVPNNIEIADGASLIIETRETGYHIKLSGAISGSGDIEKRNSATLTLAGINTFSGETTLVAGTLVVGNSLALQNSALEYSNGTVVFAGGITDFTLGGLSGDIPIELKNADDAPIALTLGGSGGTHIFTGGLSGTGSVIKVSGGTQILSGTNTFTGATTVLGGTLGFTSADGLAPETDLYLVGSAALQLDYDGTIRVHTFYINGSLRPAGRYDEHNLPAFISGPGAIFVEVGRVSALIIR